jgi:hypothetical protein
VKDDEDEQWIDGKEINLIFYAMIES